MWKKIKSFFWIQEIQNEWWGWPFYPLMNSNYNVEKMSRTDYLKLYQSWVYLASTTIADTIAELEYWVYNKDKETQHKNQDLVDYDFLKKVATYMLLNWNAFVYKEMIWNKIDSLAILRPDLVTIEEKPDWTLLWYRYNWYGRNMFFQPEEIINFEMFNPLEARPWKVKWVSPTQAVAIQAEMDNTANKWNWNFFKNGWSVRDILKHDNEVSQEAQKRYIDKWKKEFQGVNNSHKVAFLDKGIDYETVGANQKELDFVESRRFTRDEILAIYKIPKMIVWITDDVNLANAKVAKETFYKVCISPLATQISQTLTKELFNNEVNFEFINVVPKDIEQLERDLNNWAITINEYRQERWFEEINNWEYLKLEKFKLVPKKWEIPKPPNPQQEGYKREMMDIVKSYIKWTEQRKERKRKWKEKIWKEKIQRTDKYEAKWEDEINKIFDQQKTDIINNLEKWVTKIRKPKFNKTKYQALWKSALRPLFTEVAQNEWNEALKIIDSTDVFQVWNPEMNKYIRENVERIAKDVDETTKETIMNEIEQWNEEGLWADEITDNITAKFENFKRSRSKMIARTEITRASNEASEQAYKQWGITQKEYLAELDSRTSEICQELNWKVVNIWENFAEKGDTIAWYKLDYQDIPHPPTHPNCRSTLIPVIE